MDHMDTAKLVIADDKVVLKVGQGPHLPLIDGEALKCEI